MGASSSTGTAPVSERLTQSGSDTRPAPSCTKHFTNALSPILPDATQEGDGLTPAEHAQLEALQLDE